MTLTECPACAAPVEDGYLFCEACGHDLSQPAPDPATAAPGTSGPAASSAPAERAGRDWVSSAGVPERCPGCSGTDFGAEGYCETCGQRRPAGEPHTEFDLGELAGVTDKGRRHHRNEDALGLVGRPGLMVAVVCDGVGSSTRPDAASHAAVDAAMPALLAELDRGESVAEAITAGTRAAQAAAALVAGPQPGNNPPSSTFVCAVVQPDVVTIGWVGDSRAYWLPADGPAQCLTTDDAVPGRFADVADPAAGATDPDGARVAEAVPEHAGALLRWLGADAPDTEPHLRTLTPTGPGRVLVCSDGLFRYYPEDALIGAAAPDDAPLPAAQELVRLALEAGGADNVTVALLTYPPGSNHA